MVQLGLLFCAFFFSFVLRAQSICLVKLRGQKLSYQRIYDLYAGDRVRYFNHSSGAALTGVFLGMHRFQGQEYAMFYDQDPNTRLKGREIILIASNELRITDSKDQEISAQIATPIFRQLPNQCLATSAANCINHLMVLRGFIPPNIEKKLLSDPQGFIQELHDKSYYDTFFSRGYVRQGKDLVRALESYGVRAKDTTSDIELVRHLALGKPAIIGYVTSPNSLGQQGVVTVPDRKGFVLGYGVPQKEGDVGADTTRHAVMAVAVFDSAVDASGTVDESKNRIKILVYDPNSSQFSIFDYEELMDSVGPRFILIEP